MLSTASSSKRRLRIFLNHCNTIFHLQSSPSSSSSSSSSNPLHNYYLRKRRKWPLSPYKTKWHQTFAEQLAMEALKASPKTHLLSSLINSFATYQIDPSPKSYHFIIKTLTQDPSKFHQIPPVLDHIQKVENFETPEFIFVGLIKFYGEIGMIEDAVKLFFKIPEFRCSRSVHSLNALLSVLCRNQLGLEIVPQILIKSQLLNIRVECSSFRILIRALCGVGRVNHAIELLNYMVNYVFSVDGKICSLILSTMCKKDCGVDEIMCFLDEMRGLGFCPDVADWLNVIRVLVRKGKAVDAMGVLNKMKRDGSEPDLVSYDLVMDGLIMEDEYGKADEVFDEMLVSGLVPDISTYNIYINGLCMQNKMQEGIKMLSDMEELGCRPPLATYHIILKALCMSGQVTVARELIRGMELKGLQLGSQTYEVMICGLISDGELDEACCWLKDMMDKCSATSSKAFDEVIHVLCQTDQIDRAFEMLRDMVDKSIPPGFRAWEALIHRAAPAHTGMSDEISIDFGECLAIHSSC